MKKIILAAAPLDPVISYEYHNFLKPLEKIGCKVIPFDFLEHMRLLGRDGMNRKLLEVVRCEQPDIVFFVPHTNQFIPEIVDEIGKHAITLGYLFDDMWRIKYSRFWAKHFNFITTSDVNGLRKFRDVGFTNVIYSPFACNHEVYRKEELPKLYDITFVGQYHPQREWYINWLKKSGFEVRVWGLGWPEKMLSMQEMINVFNQSRINLNLSNCVSWDIRYLTTLSRPIKNTLRVWLQAVRTLTHSDMKTVEQVKGRHFEINACGGFQLSYYVKGLEHFYTIGDEIALFVSPKDLVEKIRYYLEHKDEREAIAQRGQERTLQDHTMEKRLQDILKYFKLS
ncbi:MAG: glycosyltransferase [Candidatus Omnitrophica bacterium]|nr:glycosyltransferase [Candidatus Omnitrophota bacterium]MBU1047381.1 glycosyltransferase [Candidatus Omnitrophota bacterium]MBU1630184.1 glycosyltransferase [Candidatus Omnitrophota bacterium]MBU1889034.1 glycosyltransferase [Candidatus Omnitrophota bacterium]